jgi:hypothetical protein
MNADEERRGIETDRYWLGPGEFLIKAEGGSAFLRSSASPAELVRQILICPRRLGSALRHRPNAEPPTRCVGTREIPDSANKPLALIIRNGAGRNASETARRPAFGLLRLDLRRALNPRAGGYHVQKSARKNAPALRTTRNPREPPIHYCPQRSHTAAELLTCIGAAALAGSLT